MCVCKYSRKVAPINGTSQNNNKLIVKYLLFVEWVDGERSEWKEIAKFEFIFVWKIIN